MVLFRVVYVEHFNAENDKEAYILCNGFPTHKQVLKRINMLDYCGHEMTDEDYKHFVLELGNYTKYNIEIVEKIEYIKFDN